MKLFLKGAAHGIPIMLGYLSVAFGFGILAVKSGISALAATIISATNLTSAGQAAGVAIIAAGGTVIEMILTQLTINLRYSLMGISLSQKLDDSFTAPHRLIVSFGITDEIFAVASGQKEKLKPTYMYGLIFVAFVGWVSGTFIGAAAGELLPEDVTNAMGIVLYGMFIAIIVPPAKKERGALAVIVIAVLISVIFKYLAAFITSGFAVMISAIIAASAGALIFPTKEVEQNE